MRGSICPLASKLPNQLIQEGAKLVVQVEDVLEELNLSALTREQPALPRLLSVDTEEKAQVLRSLELGPQHVDELSRRTVLLITLVRGACRVFLIKLGSAPSFGLPIGR